MPALGETNKQYDASGMTVNISVTTRVQAAPGSILTLATDSVIGAGAKRRVKGIAAGANPRTKDITAGEGSILRLAAGSTVTGLRQQDVNTKTTGLWWAVITGFLVLAVGLIAVFASFDKKLGPIFIVLFGSAAVFCLFLKEACTTFSKDATFSKRAVDTLMKTAAIASIFAVACGAPAAAWTIKKAHSVAVEESKNSTTEPAAATTSATPATPPSSSPSAP